MTTGRRNISRRRFVGVSAGLAAGFTIVPRRVLGGPGYVAPSEELTKAVIGVGGQGQSHLDISGSRLVAVCDVDAKHLAETVEKCKGVKGVRDFREILADPGIDIVHIVTPDHWHALMSVMAARAGKDVWCEKPMTRTLGEGLAVRDTIRRTGRIFRINTWFRFQDNFYGFGSNVRRIKKAVESGLLGWPLKATVSGATGFNWKFFWSGKTDITPEPVPPELDYEMWLGPAPWKPYHPHRVHGSFRGYWDYGGGGLADMGQHYLDPVQYLLGKDGTSPVSVEAEAPPQHPDAASSWDYVVLKYSDGCEIHLDGVGRYPDAPFLEGPGGKLYPKFRSSIPNFERTIDALPDPAPQNDDFHECVRTRRKFALNEENGFRSCSIIHLANAAIRLGRPLRFDPEHARFIQDDEANRLIHQPMRSPWHM
jgi:predicted dehydrogenase